MDDLTSDVTAVGRIEAVPRILEVVCRATGMGFAAVARVTETRWVACAVRDEIAFGLRPGGELDVGTTLCDEIRRSGELVVIEDVDADDQFRCHPTPRQYGFKSYISVPIHRRDGTFFGTLCAIDPKPAPLRKSGTVEMFRLFADLIALHLDAQQRLAGSEEALRRERETAQLRDQFMAVLGHDLRNPLGAIRAGVDLLAELPKGDQADRVRAMVRRSAARMSELIGNVLDLARGRLGGGLTLEPQPEDRLEGMLTQVVLELEATRPGRVIDREIRVDRQVVCDAPRLAQLLSNLVANALTHGDPDSPVRVRGLTSPDAFELSVANRGETIPPEVIEGLFQPFFRGALKPDREGLGLGLYIASEVARAHGGALSVTSADGETTFAFRMPMSLG